MANRLKGITLEIDGNTQKLTNSLSGVNKEIGSTQSALNDVKKLLKMDPGNIDLLKQKQELLTKQVQNTTTKLNELNNAQAAMDASGVDRSSDAYMALQREIIETEHNLRDLQDAANQSNAALEHIGATADSIASGAGKVADATRGLSTAAAAGLTAIVGMAYGAVTTADNLNTMARQTGFSTDELQRFSYAADLVDVSLDTITGAATKMKSNMASNSDAFARLGVSVTNADGTMRAVNDVFYETIFALSTIQNETERDQLAMEIFGRSADSLAGIIDDGGASLRMFGEEAAAAGLILDQETLDSLNATNDAMDRLKARASSTFTVAGAAAMEALMPALENILSALEGILNWIASLDEGTLTFIVTVLALVAAISPIAGLISGIASAVSAAIPIVMAMNAAIMANPVVAICVAAGIAIAAIVALVIAFWDDIEAATSAMLDAVCDFFAGAWDWICGAVEWVADAIAWAFKAAFDAVVGFGKAMANSLISIIESAANAVINVINGIISAINFVGGAVAGLFGIDYSGISSMNKVNLKRFATGGSLTSGMALVGEEGPELLTVNDGRATVTPLTATLDSKSLGALNGAGNSQTNINIQFTGSLAQLARVLQPAISTETTRRGSSIVT